MTDLGRSVVPAKLTRVVMFSGGDTSWATAKRVANRHGTDGLVLLFADTKQEDEDTYRFLDEAAANVGGQLVKTAEGRGIWDVFDDEKFIGNTRVDICSRVLKREWLRRWLNANCDPADTVIYLGIHAGEEHRAGPNIPRWAPYTVEFPLLKPPMDDVQAKRWRADNGLFEQRLYRLGYTHANCGGACVKAGQAQWELLLRTIPDRYAEHEAREEAFRARHGNVSILRDRRGKKTRPLSLKAFRERLEAQPALFDDTDWGGCGCFTPLGDDDAKVTPTEGLAA